MSIFFSFTLLAILILEFAIGLAALLNSPSARANRLFFLYGFIGALWVFSSFGLINAGDYLQASSWWQAGALGMLLPAIATHFLLTFTENPLARKKAALTMLLYLPAFILVFWSLLAGTASSTLLQKSWGWSGLPDRLSPLYLVYIFWVIIIYFWSLYIVIKFRHKMLAGPKRNQVNLLLAGILLLGFGRLGLGLIPHFTTVIPTAQTAIHFIGFALLGLCLYRWEKLTVNPMTAPDNILAALGDGLFLLDEKQSIKYANRAALDICGQVTDEMIGQPFFDLLVSPNDRSAFLYAVSLISDQGVSSYICELNLVTAEGKQPMSISMAPVFSSGGTLDGLACIVHDNRERRKLESELEHRQKYLQSVLHNAPDGIIAVDTEQRITSWNRGAEYIFGFSQDECLGHKVDDLIAGPENHDEASSITSDVSSGLTVLRWETVRYHKDGHPVQVVISASPTYVEGQRLGAVGVYTDISARKKAEEKLRQSEEKYRNLFDNIQLGIYRANPDGGITLANPALMRMLGLTDQEDVAAYNIFDYGYTNLNRGNEFIQRMESDGRLTGFEATWRRTDGMEITVSQNVHQVRDEYGRLLFYEGTVEEITQRKKNEAELEQYHKHLETLVYDRTHELELLNEQLVYDINIREHTEKALRESEEQFRDLVEKAGMAIVIYDKFGRLKYWNRRFGQMLGYDDDDMEHLTLQQVIHPDDLKLLLSTPEPLSPQEIRCHRRDGRTITVEVDTVPLVEEGQVTSYRIYIWDITERKEGEEKLRLSDEILRRAAALVMVIDSQGGVSYISPSVKNMLGWVPEELVGDGWWKQTCFDGQEADRARARFTQQARGEVEPDDKPVECRTRTADNRSCWLLWQYTPGPAHTIIGIGQDITLRKQSEAAMQTAKEAAETANRLKSEFFFNVSHEIRTPLNVITGYAELILTTREVEQAHQQARRVISEADVLLSLINQLLDHAKLEAGKMILDNRPLDLNRMLQNVTSGLAVKAAEKGLAFNLHIADDLPGRVLADQMRLRQVIFNLAGNAIKFTAKGFVAIKASLDGWDGGNAQVRFSVVDTGIGIPKEKQATIFNSFTQADGSITRKYGGTGLGTTISRQLVRLMNGEIGLESQPGQGSMFWFVIPLQPYEGELEPVDDLPVDDALAPLPACGPGGYVLLVDDYEVNRDIAGQHLRSLGCQVDEAGTGRQALDLCRENTYNLVLMDIQMPEMDGFTAAAAIRSELPAFDMIPIVAMTAHADDETRELCRKAGMNDIIVKPIRKKAFLEVVAQYLGCTIKSAPRVVDDDNAALPMDFDRALEEFGSRELLVQVMTRFLADLPNDMDKMRLMMEDESQRDNLRKAAHRLRGGAGTLTAMPLSRLAAELEKKAPQAPVRELGMLLEAIANQTERLRLAYDEFLQKGSFDET